MTSTLQAAYNELTLVNSRLREEIERLRTQCGGNCRYWEGRWRGSDLCIKELEEARKNDQAEIERLREALKAADEKIEAWNLVETLRAPEGHSVTLVCDNPDFNGQPNCALDVCGDWTDWEQRRFTGDTILDALRCAHEVMMAREHAVLYGEQL